MPDDPTNLVAYCGIPPVPATLIGSWNLDPVLLAALALWAAALYRSGRGAFGWSAWGLAVLVFVSPLCNLTSALFSARVMHQVLLSAAIVPLVLLGLALVRRDRLRVLGVGPAILLHAAAMWAWHAPGPYAWALATVPGYWLMQATLDGAGLCLLPLNLAQAAIRDGRLVEVMAEFRGRELVLHAVQPPGHLPVPKTRALIDFLTEHFGPRAQRNEAREK